MDGWVRLSALSARLDRVLQSTEQDFIVLEKEDQLANNDVGGYLRALQANVGTTIFRVGNSDRGSDRFDAVRFPASWFGGNSAPGALSVFDVRNFPDIYMVFGPGYGWLLFMRSAAPVIVLKATLETIERRISRTGGSIACDAAYFLEKRSSMKSGVAWDVDLCNTYKNSRIVGSKFVLEYAEYDGNMKVSDFVLTYCFKTQSPAHTSI
jgi:hypothetical protein